MADHIQIGDISPRIQYSGDGVQTAFTYPFPVFANGDLDVYEDTTLKIISTDYSVAGAGNSTGGTVIFVTAPASGVVVTLKRNMTIARTSDFQESGEFRAKVINDELDVLTALLQQVQELSARALHMGATDQTPSSELPDKSSRAGLFLAFDGDGLPLASPGPVDGLAVSAFMGTLIDDADAATARATLALVPGTHVLAPAGDGSGLTGIATGATDAQKANIALNAFRIAVNGGLSVQNMVDGVTDEFTDQTGVDTGASSNQTYDATNDYYHNPAVAGSDLTTGGTAGTASSDNETTTASSAAFTDGAGTTADADCWVTGTTPTYPVYLRFAFTATKIVNRYRVLPQDDLTRAPKTWTLQGRVTAGAWATLDTQTNITSWATGTWKAFDFVNSTTYDEYQILVSANNGASYVAIAEVELILVAAAPNMTLISTAQTALAQPSDVFVVLWHETVDAVTLDTDLKAWASIDGTTWAQAALTLAASLSGNEQILTGTADVSAQTGTSVKWKIETLNNKEQRLHGVSEQWS